MRLLTIFLCRMIGVGFSNNKASLERLPGWEQESWAYHGDDGKTFFGDNQGQGKPYGPTFTVNDTVGCGINFATGCGFFTKNGTHLGMYTVVIYSFFMIANHLCQSRQCL